MKSFEHGGDVQSFAKSIQCDINEVIDLSSNINFLKPRIKKDFNDLNIASYPKYEVLYKKLSKHYNVKTSQLELYNGGSSAIFELFSHLNLQRCCIYSPAYLEYKKAAITFNYELQLINRFDNMSEKVKKNSLVVFVNPSTPDGSFYNIDALLKIWKKRNCIVLIDESFIEFTSFKSAISCLNTYDNVYILKSMTKFYSCAGIRIGTLLSNSNNIQKLRNKTPLWKLSYYDATYLQEVLKDKAFRKKTKMVTSKNAKLLHKVLEKYAFIQTVHESQANYVLIKLKNKTAKQLQKHLLQYKIMIRNCENFDYLDKYHVRIAVKNKQSIKILKKALDEWIV